MLHLSLVWMLWCCRSSIVVCCCAAKLYVVVLWCCCGKSVVVIDAAGVFLWLKNSFYKIIRLFPDIIPLNNNSSNKNNWDDSNSSNQRRLSALRHRLFIIFVFFIGLQALSCAGNFYKAINLFSNIVSFTTRLYDNLLQSH